MNIKITIVLVSFLTVLSMLLYALFNPSYQISWQAKYHYEMSEYDDAYLYAKEAFALDPYNRMAATVMAQSLISLKYVKYIQEAKEYMKEINKIVDKKEIKNADKAKIRLMCQIMIKTYIKLAPSVVTDTELVEEAAFYHAGFEQLLEKVN